MNPSRCDCPRVASLWWLAAALLTSLTLDLSPLGAQLPATVEDARVGSDLERYLRAAELAVVAPGPWALTEDSTRGVRLGLLELRTGFNAGLPSVARGDGPAWAGNGAFSQLTGSLSWRSRHLRARLAPSLWWTQNSDVRLVPSAIANPANPYVDPMRPRSIDLPQQFGSGAVGRIDAGESEVVFERWILRTAVTTASRRIGAGAEHSLLMQGDAGGFPRLEIGAPERGLATPVGRFFGTLASGRLSQSAQSPATRTGSRHGSFIDMRWSPFANGAVELGASRFYHRDWSGWRAEDLLVPFGSLFFDEQIYAGGDADNQLAVIYSRVRVPSAGLQLFAEYGKNDRSRDTRDLLLQLEHNAAWLAGFERVWTAGNGQFWALNATMAGSRVAAFDSLRGQATFYEHSPIRQGHTQRGQLLGTALLQGLGGAELRIDRYSLTERRALILHTRYLPNRGDLAVQESQLRSEWGVMAEWMRLTSRGALHARLGGIADVGRHPTSGDAFSLHLTLGYSLRPQ